MEEASEVIAKTERQLLAEQATLALYDALTQAGLIAVDAARVLCGERGEAVVLEIKTGDEEFPVVVTVKIGA